MDFSLQPGTIYLAATPIGNVADASSRLCLALSQADLLAAEDTRRLLNLAGRLGVELSAPIISFHEHNESERLQQLLLAAQRGSKIVVVSDAGMPTICDPGFRLVRSALAAGVAVQALPGPSAVLQALTLSGLATDRFAMEGFLPRKAAERIRYLTKLARDERTLVFFESARRLPESLRDLAQVFGPDRPAAICRELTKSYEQVIRGSLAQVIDQLQDPVLGEITLVVAGNVRRTWTNKETIAAALPGETAESGIVAESLLEDAVIDPVELVRQLVAGGISRKVAAKAVATVTGGSKNRLYQAALSS